MTLCLNEGKNPVFLIVNMDQWLLEKNNAKSVAVCKKSISVFVLNYLLLTNIVCKASESIRGTRNTIELKLV